MSITSEVPGRDESVESLEPVRLPPPALHLGRGTMEDPEHDAAVNLRVSSREVQSGSSDEARARSLDCAERATSYEPMKAATFQEGPLGSIEKPSAEHAASTTSHGIYWRSPLVMVSGWLFGLLFSIAHHLVYDHMDGRVVASTNEQQWYIRAGSAFAIIVQTLFCGAVWTAYTQWLWRTMRRQPISLAGLDAAFAAGSSLWSLAHIEIVLNLPMCFALGLVAWCLYIPSIFTPAALSVISSSNTATVTAMVSTLDISDPTMSHNYAYFTPLNVSGDFAHANNRSMMFVAARSILTRLSSASASEGEILALQPPFDHSSYELSFLAPYVNCSSSNETVRKVTDAVLEAKNTTWAQEGLAFLDAYFAFVPSPDSDIANTTSVIVDGVTYTALEHPRLQDQPVNATNEIWLKYYRYSPDTNNDGLIDPSNQKPVVQPRYLTCSLFSASHDISLSFNDGVQNISKRAITPHEQIAYPTTDPSVPSNLTQLAFTSLFMVMTDQLVGHMGVFVNATTGIPQYGSIATDIEHNSLLGSNDLDYFFYLHSLVDPKNDKTFSPQRLADKALAHNGTLPELIQEVTFNITASLLENPILTKRVAVDVKRTTPVNRYAYDKTSLWLAYGFAAGFSFIAICVGGLALFENRASHDNAVSTLISVCRAESLTPRFPPCCHGRLPLPDETLKTKLQLKRDADETRETENLQVVGESAGTLVCEVCKERRASSVKSPRPEKGRMSSIIGISSSARKRSQSQQSPDVAAAPETTSPLLRSTIEE